MIVSAVKAMKKTKGFFMQTEDEFCEEMPNK